MEQCFVRGIRGAITVENNTSEEITNATKELLEEVIKANSIEKEYIASIFFTLTPDLNASFPAKAARELGWHEVPLLCAVEVNVPDSMGKCIRVLLHVNTKKAPLDIKHVYLRDARKLRTDLI